MKRLVFFTGTLVLLSGCGMNRVPYPTESKNNAQVKIAEAAEVISHSFVELSRIQEASTPPHRGKVLPDPDTFGMQGTASIDWAGPIEPLVKNIANASRYKLRVMGHRPSIPVVVSINTKNTPLAHILRDVDYMAGKRASIKVFPKRRVIELRYARA